MNPIALLTDRRFDATGPSKSDVITRTVRSVNRTCWSDRSLKTCRDEQTEANKFQPFTYTEPETIVAPECFRRSGH
jgi:hypothetical protein